LHVNDTWTVIDPSSNDLLNWAPFIDATVGGMRVIMPGSITGAGGSDANLNAPAAPSYWIGKAPAPQWQNNTPSGYSPLPMATLEIWTDHGISG
jgi:hypothetical protein